MKEDNFVYCNHEGRNQVQEYASFKENSFMGAKIRYNLIKNLL